jgi:polar amino acid transport system permease protein
MDKISLPPQLRPKKWRTLDSAALIAAGAAIFWLGRSMLLDFNYPWDWSTVPQFLVSVSADGSWKLGSLGLGLIMTVKLALWAVAFGLAFGLALALARVSQRLYPRLLSRSITELCRNIPPLVLVLIAFYFLSAQLVPWPLLSAWVREGPPFLQKALEVFTVSPREFGLFFPAVLALGLYEAAYFAEIFRGAIISMNRGQREAAFCLGLSRFQEYRFIILPQVFHKTIPQLAGQFISTVKESSIVSVISLAELTYSGQQLSATIHKPFEVWLTVAALYLMLNALLCAILWGFAVSAKFGET